MPIGIINAPFIMFERSVITAALLSVAILPLRAQDPNGPDTQDTTRVINNARDTVTMGAAPDAATLRARDSTHMAFANKDEGAWIGIEGHVRMVGEKSFILGYEGGTVAVALGGEALRAHTFHKDQHLTVYGRVDTDFLDRRVIKARAVVVDGEHSTEHLVIGEGDAIQMLTASHVPGTVVHGRVTDISGRHVTLEQADGRIIVDTSTLSYDPMTAQPHNRVELGDQVTAQGLIRGELWSERLMKATALDVIKMSRMDGNMGAADPEVKEQ